MGKSRLTFVVVPPTLLSSQWPKAKKGTVYVLPNGDHRYHQDDMFPIPQAQSWLGHDGRGETDDEGNEQRHVESSEMYDFTQF